jgi:hypothetical protein
MTTTPAPTLLTGRDIGVAERATRAVLETLLIETGTSFHQWIALNLVATNGFALDRNELVGQMTAGLRVDEQSVTATLDELMGLQLLVTTADAPVRVEATEAGRARYEDIQTQIDGIAQRLYGGLPAEDLATAHRVLATVTERARAALG